MADQVDLGEPKGLEQLMDIEGHAVGIVAVVGDIAVTMTARIDGDDAEVGLQRLDLMAEHRC